MFSKYGDIRLRGALYYNVMEPRCLAEIRAGDCHLFNKIPIVCNDYFQDVYMSGGVCIKVLWSTWQILTEYLLETCIIIIN